MQKSFKNLFAKLILNINMFCTILSLKVFFKANKCNSDGKPNRLKVFRYADEMIRITK